MNVARKFALLFVALALAPAAAHMLELPNKIDMSRDEYLVAQQIYRGWALLGVVVLGALLSTLAFAILSRGTRDFKYALIAFLCIVGTQVNFWALTFPTNQETLNWTVLPDHWQALRAQWEYSHAASAFLDLVALITLILSVPESAPQS